MATVYASLDTMRWKIVTPSGEYVGDLVPSPIDGTPIPKREEYEVIPDLTGAQARSLIVEAVQRETKTAKGQKV